MKTIKIWGTVILTLVIIILILQNTETVVTRILFFSISMPRAVLLFITGLLGFLIGILISLKFGKK